MWFYTENTIVENSAHIHYGVDEVTSVLHAEGEGVDGEEDAGGDNLLLTSTANLIILPLSLSSEKC